MWEGRKLDMPAESSQEFLMESVNPPIEGVGKNSNQQLLPTEF